MLVQFLRRADELRPADFGEGAEQLSGIGLFIIDWPAWHRAAADFPISFERGLILCGHQGTQSFPLGIGLQENLVGPSGRTQKTIDGSGMRGNKALGKDIADRGDRLGQAEFGLCVAHIVEPAITLALQPRTEIPEIQAGLRFTLPQLLVEKRWGTEHQTRLSRKIDATPPRCRAHDQPALVERAARDRERAPLYVRELVNRRIRLHHDRADCGGIRIEFERPAERALARNPEPVDDSDVDRSAVESKLAGFG